MDPLAGAPRPERSNAVALRELLQRARYSRHDIQELLGISGDVLSRPQDRQVHLRRLNGNGALETLMRLFLLDEPVDADVVASAIAPTPVDVLGALGVVEEDGHRLRGTVRLVPHGELILASDLPDREGTAAHHVAGLHRPSVTLADLTVRRPVDRALDVGTGFGIQAMLASHHATHVVATDINERALAFARFNAVLNGISNIEFRQGSFFEPVQGERFDLVVCNPPYVISPETEYLFRDSGLGRDRVSETLVGELPRHLEQGGFGTIMASWILDATDPPVRPTAWLAGAGCDAWVLHTAVEDALTAAAAWNRDLADDEVRYGQAIDRWTNYFRAERIDAIAYGAIVLRRRSATADAPNWVRSRELPNEPRVRPDPHLLRLFSGPDRSQALPDDAALGAEPISLVDGALVTTHLRHDADGWAEAAEITLAEGIPFTFDLDRFTAGFLVRLDGTQPLGDVLDAFAAEHDAPPERVRASGIRIARELLEVGMAVPATTGDSAREDD